MVFTNKWILNVSVTKLLMLVYILLLTTIITVTILENKKLAKIRQQTVEVSNKSNIRQSTLTLIRKGSDYSHVNFLRFLFYEDSRKREEAENKLYEEISNNDKNIQNYQNYINDSAERLLFNKLINARVENAKVRSLLINHLKKGRRVEAVRLNIQYGYAAYEKFEQAITALFEYTTLRDRKKAVVLEDMYNTLEEENRWINFYIAVLLILLGLMVMRTVLKIKKGTFLLMESERKYRLLIEKTTEIIEAADSNGKFIMVNDTFKQKLEYTDNEISDLTVFDILDFGSLRQCHRNPDRTEFGDVITGIRKTLKSKTGKKILVEGNIILNYNSNNAFESSTAFFNDITEKNLAEKALLASEERYKQIFDHSPTPILLVKYSDLSIININYAAIDQYGYTKADFFQMTWLHISSEENARKLQQDLTDRNRKFKYSAEEIQTAKSGEQKIMDIHAVNILLDGIPSILIRALDITEHKRREDSLSEAIIQTQEEERFLIGSDLHDNICQIIATIKIRLGLLEKHMNESGQQMFTTTNELIDLALEEVRNVSHQLSPAIFDNTNLKDAILKLNREFNIDNKYEISFSFDDKLLGLSISRDKVLTVYRILQEQFRNIRKHAFATSISIHVLLKRGVMNLIISDNGVGFSIDESVKGIGLANIERRAKLVGGRYILASTLGTGCSITVEIPV